VYIISLRGTMPVAQEGFQVGNHSTPSAAQPIRCEALCRPTCILVLRNGTEYCLSKYACTKRAAKRNNGPGSIGCFAQTTSCMYIRCHPSPETVRSRDTRHISRRSSQSNRTFKFRRISCQSDCFVLRCQRVRVHWPLRRCSR
jgi:hypothetical protein